MRGLPATGRMSHAHRRATAVHVIDAMVLIAATGIAFVPIRLFLWENWHFPEEWSVPGIWRSALEVNVSLIPLSLSLSRPFCCWA